jgi:CheY-like chemotaxis protein
MPKSFSPDELLILSVDDDQVNLMVVEQLLNAQPGQNSVLPWRVVSVCSGDEALEALDDEAHWPDIVLLDYTLSGESGDQVGLKRHPEEMILNK